MQVVAWGTAINEGSVFYMFLFAMQTPRAGSAGAAADANLLGSAGGACPTGNGGGWRGCSTGSAGGTSSSSLSSSMPTRLTSHRLAIVLPQLAGLTQGHPSLGVANSKPLVAHLGRAERPAQPLVSAAHAPPSFAMKRIVVDQSLKSCANPTDQRRLHDPLFSPPGARCGFSPCRAHGRSCPWPGSMSAGPSPLSKRVKAALRRPRIPMERASERSCVRC